MNQYDGGGSILKYYFTQRVADLVAERGTPFNRTFEWCAGMGEIGRELLDEGLTKTLVLLDINKDALEEGKRKWGSNKITYYVSNNLEGLDKKEKFDLVVGNPPSYYNVNTEHPHYPEWKDDLRPHDPKWKLRYEFYSKIKEFLTPEAKILINEVEPYKKEVYIRELWDTRPRKPFDEFIDLIDKGGLNNISCYPVVNLDGTGVYFMESEICGSCSLLNYP